MLPSVPILDLTSPKDGSRPPRRDGPAGDPDDYEIFNRTMRRHLELWAAMTLAACSGSLGERSVGRIDTSIPLPEALRELRIELENGSFEVHPGMGREVRVHGDVLRAADTDAQLRALEAQGVELTLTPDPAVAGCYVLRGPVRPPELQAVLAVDAKIELPADLPLRIHVAGSGGLIAEDRAAATSLATRRGDIRLMRCSGAAKIESGGGTVIVFNHEGDLDVETGVGDMQVFVRRPGRRLRLINGIGNIQCMVPPDVGFRVDARTQTGKLANGFGLQVEHPSTYSATMVGQRGDGATEIVMRTGTGHLSLSHKVFD